MVASRMDDGRNDLTVEYSKPDDVGYWQPPEGAPTTGGGMAAAWLGFVDPLIDVEPVALNGPDALSSPGYAKDYDEVRRLGSATSTERTPRQTAIARFFAESASLSAAAVCM